LGGGIAQAVRRLRPVSRKSDARPDLGEALYFKAYAASMSELELFAVRLPTTQWMRMSYRSAPGVACLDEQFLPSQKFTDGCQAKSFTNRQTRSTFKESKMKLLIIWMLNALALIAVANFVPGIHVDGFVAALVAAFLLGLVNTLIRPLLLLLTLPVTLLTLGLFIFVINGTLFWFVGSVLRGFVVDSFWHGVLGAVLYSIFSWALSAAAAQLMRK
jgi:putative membrane protein